MRTAIRVSAASRELAEAPPTPLQLLAALGAEFVEELGFGAYRPVHVPDVVALGVVVAPDELAELPELHDEFAGFASFLRAFGARLAGLLLVALEIGLALVQRTLQGIVEIL